MKSITIHNMDSALVELVRQKAKAEKKSLNMVIKETLEKALGIRRMAAPEDKNPFARFCGVWSERDLNAFLKAVADNEKVDSKDWQ